jgi:hypothetical protein
MNKLKKIGFSIGVVMLFLHINFASAQPNAGRGISLQVFYDELSYYGDWINNPEYGYVWRPNVGNDFRPYFTNGRWMMTEYGNTWVSDYEWGWAPFHYGRWFYDNYDGWVWVPDTVWGPAWVDWRSGNGYYGWAPLGPRFNININIGTRYYPDNYWVFIPQRCIYYPSYYRYWEPRRNTIIIQNTTIINNIYNNRNVRYYSGPNATDIRRATRQNVRVYKITDAGKSGATRVGNGSINVYRPQVNNVRDARPTSIATTRPTRSDLNRNNNNTDNRVNRPNGDRNNNNIQRPNSSSSRPSNVERPTRENQQPSHTVNNGTRVPQGSSNVNKDRNTNQEQQSQQRPTQQREVNAPAQQQRVERPATTQPRQQPAAQRQQSEAPAAQRPTRTSSAPAQQQRVERPAATSSAPARTQSSGNSNSDNSSSSRATRTNR